MSTVTSPDSTVIDYDRYGDGPAVIFTGGAAAHRAIDEGTTPDREAPRGRGVHGDRLRPARTRPIRRHPAVGA